MSGASPVLNGPVFVTGASRSGKTIMRGILSSHPRIVVSRRTEMWPRFYLRFGDLGDDRNLERCLQVMLRRQQIAALGTDMERLRREFRSGERTYPQLFACFHEQYARQCGKPRWGDQTGGLEKVAEEIMAAYPAVKMVHLVRDPRDRYVALTEKRATRRLTLERSTANWARSAACALRNGRRHPDDYLAVRYEALVGQSEQTVRKVCAFLGEDFDPAMLRMESEDRYDERRSRSGTTVPLTSEYVGCHRDALGGWALRFVNVVAGPQMRAFGYTDARAPARAGRDG